MFCNKKILISILLLFILGCSARPSFLKQEDISDRAGRESIYQYPKDKDYSRSNVAIFRFKGPVQFPSVNYVQVPDPGYDASYRLHQQLLKLGVFKSVIPAYENKGIPLTRQIEIAKEHGCDLLINGKVLYYFEGSPYLNSRVDEEITVFDVETGKPIWYAESTEVGIPIPYRDYYIVTIDGTPAPPASALILANAKKFSAMLLGFTN